MTMSAAGVTDSGVSWPLLQPAEAQAALLSMTTLICVKPDITSSWGPLSLKTRSVPPC